MDGQLYVSSQVNIGTQFWFALALPVVDYNVTSFFTRTTRIAYNKGFLSAEA